MNEAAIKPLNNNVLIRMVEVSATFGKSKIVKPDSTKDEEAFQCPRGKVVAVGPGARATKTGERITIDLKPGDAVFIRKHLPEQLTAFDKTLVMIDAGMVMAVVDSGVFE